MCTEHVTLVSKKIEHGYVIILKSRNTKHFPCFDRVTETRVQVLEHEKCCGNTSQLASVSQTSMTVPISLWKFRGNAFYLFYKTLREI